RSGGGVAARRRTSSTSSSKRRSSSPTRLPSATSWRWSRSSGAGGRSSSMEPPVLSGPAREQAGQSPDERPEDDLGLGDRLPRRQRDARALVDDAVGRKRWPLH